MNETGSHPDGREILALLDGELSPERAEAVREHCESCAECRRTREELSSVGRMLRSRPEEEPLRPIWPDVRERLESSDRPLLRPLFGLAAAAAVAAGILLALILFPAERPREQSDGPYLWSAVGSSLGESGGEPFSNTYTSTPSAEGK